MHTRYLAVLICQILFVVAKSTAAPLQQRDIVKGALIPRAAYADAPINKPNENTGEETISSTTATIKRTEPTSLPASETDMSKDSDFEQKGWYRGGNGWRGSGGNGWGNGNGCGGNWRRDASYWHRGYGWRGGGGNSWNGGGGCYTNGAGRLLPMLSSMVLMMMVVGCLIGVGAVLQS